MAVIRKYMIGSKRVNSTVSQHIWCQRSSWQLDQHSKRSIPSPNQNIFYVMTLSNITCHVTISNKWYISQFKRKLNVVLYSKTKLNALTTQIEIAEKAWILFSKSRSPGLKHYTRYYKESLRLCVTKWWISSFISGGYTEVHIWLLLEQHFAGSTVIYAGCVLTLSLNDDLGKWVRRAPRDSEQKNVYLRMTALQYVTERRCQGRAQNKCP